MIIFEKIPLIKNHISKLRDDGKTIGLVPTMGALHKGHISLIEKAKKENDIVVASIFINPNQFNNKSDFENYPRTIKSDIALLESADCDILFLPSTAEMYPEPDNNVFDFGNLDKVMEGAFRPGHFNGVAVIVKKLFEAVNSHKAYFGKKDFQQLLIIKKLICMLDLPVQIIGCPIIRENDGLAMSSRNMLLTAEERKNAAKVSEILLKLPDLRKKMTPPEMKNYVAAKINTIPHLKLEYFEIVDCTLLLPVKNWHNSEDTIACIAFFAGKIRLIDNIKFIL